MFEDLMLAAFKSHAKLASPARDGGEIQTERERARKRAEGENMAAEDYHSHIKRILSQQSNRPC
ncbi:hypothetical protein EYF80_004538 [Liparis tanakae]|uniref:Uncharacterized protein n=1 Tax=Liparis tanakae TaxID=230148 RepID=A0A4Z2J6A7_9TELE|nr:hypothetical protein EYF80_004538 [Liparis tanakae]